MSLSVRSFPLILLAINKASKNNKKNRYIHTYIHLLLRYNKNKNKFAYAYTYKEKFDAYCIYIVPVRIINRLKDSSNQISIQYAA